MLTSDCFPVHALAVLTYRTINTPSFDVSCHTYMFGRGHKHTETGRCLSHSELLLAYHIPHHVLIDEATLRMLYDSRADIETAFCSDNTSPSTSANSPEKSHRLMSVAFLQ